MRVTLAVVGRFHAFHLASELERRGALDRLITTYPAFTARGFGVPPARVASLVSNELLRRSWSRAPRALRQGFDPQGFLHQRFERFAARKLPTEGDVLVGWSGASLGVLRRARELGYVRVLERGSAHVETQLELLEEEHARHGAPPPRIHPRVRESELAEYEEADAICVPSLFAERSFLERGFPAWKLIRLPLGVSLEGFHPAPEPPKTFRILHCGAVTLQKGCHHLLEAFHRLDAPEAELVFCGRVADEMRALRAKHESPRVRFLGSRPKAELPTIHRDSSVLSLASVQDGFGMVLPQAMASGLPVVATVNTGAPDIVTDGAEGFVVPIRDPDALAERLQRLHDDAQLRERMGRAARERVARGLSWSDYGDRAVEAYRGLLARRAGPERLAA